MLSQIKTYLPHFVAQAFCSPDKFKLLDKQEQGLLDKKIGLESEHQSTKRESSTVGYFTNLAVSYVPQPIKNILKNPLAISGIAVSAILMKELYSRTVSGMESENQQSQITNGLSDID